MSAPRAPAPAQPGFVTARRILAPLGALLAASGVALSAWAMHGVAEPQRLSVFAAAVMLLGHGVAIAALVPLAIRRMAWGALAAMAAGVVLFAGSVAANAALGVPPRLAPLGGSVLILSWLAYAAQAWSR